MVETTMWDAISADYLETSTSGQNKPKISHNALVAKIRENDSGVASDSGFDDGYEWFHRP